VEASRGVIGLTGGEPEIPTVAIVDGKLLSPDRKLAAALDRAEVWTLLRRAQRDRQPADLRIVVKPELGGFAPGSPTATDPRLIEHLLDLLYDHGFSNAAVVGTCDSSAAWAENRDLHALADLLGYRYETPKGRPYDILDLADHPAFDAFPPGCVMHGCAISNIWLDADYRIVFSKSRTDEAAGYALCLDTLIDVLPLPDKNTHYRRRRDPGDVAAALLAVAPVQFCLIDGIVAGHGPGGRRAPSAIETNTLIAASDIVLADYVGALKMSLDPTVSPTFAPVACRHPVPQRYLIMGSLSPWPEWQNVAPRVREATRLRQRAEGIDRLVEPWLQCLDPELFPLKHPLDSRINLSLTPLLADPSNAWLLDILNELLGWIGQGIEAYRTMFGKDSLRQCVLPLGIDLAALPDSAFTTLIEELKQLESAVAAATRVSSELCWQEIGESTVFCYARMLPIDFDLFTRRVDIARTIQFMNDYLGGVLVPLAYDDTGRPVRQAERNVYLPQPNYLVLYHGKPIDVSKLEVVQYDIDRQRLFWKTIKSENESATCDDGIATFERTAEGTRVTIMGRQQFMLPTFWQVFDPKYVPGLKPMLVTHAYQTFFDRTMANLEAVVEGREIRIGRPVDELPTPPIELLMPLLKRLMEIATPVIAELAGQGRRPGEPRGETDADGFTHVRLTKEPATSPEFRIAELSRFIDRLGQAITRDLLRPATTP